MNLLKYSAVHLLQQNAIENEDKSFNFSFFYLLLSILNMDNIKLLFNYGFLLSQE
jgi:hypothetical protein